MSTDLTRVCQAVTAIGGKRLSLIDKPTNTTIEKHKLKKRTNPKKKTIIVIESEDENDEWWADAVDAMVLRFCEMVKTWNRPQKAGDSYMVRCTGSIWTQPQNQANECFPYGMCKFFFSADYVGSHIWDKSYSLAHQGVADSKKDESWYKHSVIIYGHAVSKTERNNPYLYPHGHVNNTRMPIYRLSWSTKPFPVKIDFLWRSLIGEAEETEIPFGSEDNSEYLVRRAKIIFAENKAAILTGARNLLGRSKPPERIKTIKPYYFG